MSKDGILQETVLGVHTVRFLIEQSLSTLMLYCIASNSGQSQINTQSYLVPRGKVYFTELTFHQTTG